MTRHIPPRAAREREMRRLDASHVALTQGSKCRAAWQGGDVYFDAVVTRVNEDGSYALSYEDGSGDTDARLHHRFLQHLNGGPVAAGTLQSVEKYAKVPKRKRLDTEHLGLTGMYVLPPKAGQGDKDDLPNRMRFKYSVRNIVDALPEAVRLEEISIKDIVSNTNPMHLSALYEFMRILYLSTPSRTDMRMTLGTFDPNDELNENDQQKLQNIFDKHACAHASRAVGREKSDEV